MKRYTKHYKQKKLNLVNQILTKRGKLYSLFSTYFFKNELFYIYGSSANYKKLNIIFYKNIKNQMFKKF